MTFETIENAFYFVSSAAYGEHVAVVSRTTGQAYFASIIYRNRPTAFMPS